MNFFLTQFLSTYRPSYRLSYLGILVGLACLGKYHGFALGLGLIGFAQPTPALLSPWAWGLGLFVVTIPNFVLEYSMIGYPFVFNPQGPQPLQCEPRL